MSIDGQQLAGAPDDKGTIDIARPFAGCYVLTPHGEIDAYSAPELRDHVIEALASGEVTRLVVDLTRATFLDSSALGVLVGALKRMRERHGRLDVVSPPAGVRRIFEITNLDRVLDLHDTLGAALEP